MRLPTTPSMATLHRSIVNVSTVLAQTAVGGRERSQSSALICTTASTKVKFQGGPAVHPGSRRRLLWVDCSRCRAARELPRAVQSGRRSRGARAAGDGGCRRLYPCAARTAARSRTSQAPDLMPGRRSGHRRGVPRGRRTRGRAGPQLRKANPKLRKPSPGASWRST